MQRSEPCDAVGIEDYRTTDDDRAESIVARWRPEWVIDIGNGKLGVAVDDGCLVVLYPRPGNTWRPGTHIPKAVAIQIAELLKDSRLH